MPELHALQRAFYFAVTAGDVTALGAPAVVPAHGLAVYRRMYRDRLTEVLTDTFPTLAALRGAGWRELVDAYVAACAPTNPDIHDVGRRLAGFLHDAGAPADAELAALEWARAEVFFGADAAPLRQGDLTGLPAAEFVALPLRLVPASMVLELTTNADERWACAARDLAVPAPAEVPPRRVLVWRRDAMTVVHRTVDADEVACVDLLRAGTSFAAVCAALADQAEPAQRAAVLLKTWCDAELLAQVVGSPDATSAG